MLLRSSSSPILHSWPPTSASGPGPQPEPEAVAPMLRTRSVSLTTSFEVGSAPTRIPTDLQKLDKSLRPPAPAPAKATDQVKIDDRREAAAFFLSSFGLGEAKTAVEEEAALFGGGGGSRRSCGGGGKGRDDGPGPGRGSTEAYYEMMIEANPGNPLFLANYAKFLKEVTNLLSLYLILLLIKFGS